jgi:hypothetical protein
VDGLLQLQAEADAEYFLANVGRTFTDRDRARVKAGMLDAYRWQYIVSGVEEPRFSKLLTSLIDEPQGERLGASLAPIVRRTLNSVMLNQM